MATTFPITIATFDGGKFATRYSLNTLAGDFWVEGATLFLKDGITLPDNPPIFDPQDSPTVIARNDANVIIDAPQGIGKALRSAAAVLVDELNFLRDDVIGVASQTWDPAQMANATGLTSPNFTVTGAAFGDIVHPIAPYTLAGITATAYISAANTAVIRLHNGTGAAVNLVSGSWSVMVLRHTVLSPRTLAQAKTAMKNKVTAGDVD
jgi:hypothetical protein